MWISILGFIHQKIDLGLMILHRLRRRLLLPIALWGGRDMLLLKNGHWVDSRTEIPDSQIVGRYSSEKHTIWGSDTAGRATRWPWIHVTAGDRDYSDFFGTLRLGAGLKLSNDKVLTLMMHQKGVGVHEELNVMTRDGRDLRVRPTGEEVVDSSAIDTINYIR